MSKVRKATKAIAKFTKEHNIPGGDSTRGTLTYETFDLVFNVYMPYGNSFMTYNFAIDKYGEESLRIDFYENVIVPDMKSKILIPIYIISIIMIIIITIVHCIFSNPGVI